MSYFVRIDPRVEGYIAAVEGLSDEARGVLLDGITDELGRYADLYLARDPLAHESLHFRYEYVQPGDRSLFIFRFTLDGTHMPVGVVTVVFAECEIYPPP